MATAVNLIISIRYSPPIRAQGSLNAASACLDNFAIDSGCHIGCGGTTEEMEESSSPRTTWQVVEDLLADPATRTKLSTFARSCYGIEAPEAEDLLQDTAVELLHHEANVRKPEGYVFTVFKVKCLLHISRRAAARALFAGEDQSDRAGESADETERLLALKEAFSGISSRCRRLIYAYYLEGRSLKETAYDLSLSPASVFKLVSRCLGRLRRCLS